MKRLKKKVKEDRKQQPWDKLRNPKFAKFLYEVAAVSTTDLSISEGPLYGLWYFSKGFQNLWENKFAKEDRSDQELALFVRFVHRGLDDDQGLMLISAWWKRHHYEFSKAKLQYLTKTTIPRAKEFAAKIIKDRGIEQAKERQERTRQTTKFRIMQVLFVAPSGPTGIATEIGEPVASVKMQLSRMAKAGE